MWFRIQVMGTGEWINQTMLRKQSKASKASKIRTLGNNDLKSIKLPSFKAI